MNTTTTMLTGGAALQAGLGDILIQLVNIVFNLIVLSARVVWTNLFSIDFSTIFQ